MIKCVNCERPAQFKYKPTKNLTLNYCHLHTPKFLRGKNEATLLKSVVEQPKEEAPKPKRKRTTKKKIEEPVIEETPEEPVEETVEEEDGVS